MPASFDPNMGLPYGFTVGESGWGPDVSNALKKIGALANVFVLDVVDTLPGSPTNGDRYLMSASSGGGRQNQLAVRVAGAWEYYAPPLFRVVTVLSAGFSLLWDGSAWVNPTVPTHISRHAPGGADPLPWGTIHGYGLFSARPAAGAGNLGYLYFATDTGTIYRSNGTSWDAFSNSGRPIRVAPDSNDQLVWLLNETSGTFANTGAQSGHALSVSGTPAFIRGLEGLFGKGILSYQNNNPAMGGSYDPPGNAVTLSAWVRLYNNQNGWIAGKHQSSGGGTGDFAACLYVDGGVISPYIKIGSSAYTAAAPAGYGIDGQFHHLGLTFDGSTLTNWIDGYPIATTSASGNINYGTSGVYAVGAYAGVTGFRANAFIHDFRVASVVRDAAYFTTIYRNGLPGISVPA